mgnify:CR=1 FL=1
MLRTLKWLLLVPALLMIAFIVAEKADLNAQAARLTGVDAAACGAVSNPDFESLNPLGCRFRFNMGPSEFAALCEQQLTPASGWEKMSSAAEASSASLTELHTDSALVYINNLLPTRVRWVVYHPLTEHLYLGYYMH